MTSLRSLTLAATLLASTLSLSAASNDTTVADATPTIALDSALAKLNANVAARVQEEIDASVSALRTTLPDTADMTPMTVRNSHHRSNHRGFARLDRSAS